MVPSRDIWSISELKAQRAKCMSTSLYLRQKLVPNYASCLMSSQTEVCVKPDVCCWKQRDTSSMCWSPVRGDVTLSVQEHVHLFIWPWAVLHSSKGAWSLMNDRQFYIYYCLSTVFLSSFGWNCRISGEVDFYDLGPCRRAWEAVLTWGKKI